MLLLAQISDLHLDGTERASRRAADMVAYLRGLPLDALLVTGDIADHGAPPEYEEAARLLDLPFPVLPCPGNHDVRAAYRKAFLGEPTGDAPINRLHHVGGVAILMCDSSIPGQHDGLLDAQTLAWMRGTLSGLAGTPSLIAFHHPPVRLHHPLPDGLRLQREGELAELLADFPDVIAVLTGHAHTGAAATFGGRPILMAPAVTWTLRLPWEGADVANLEQPPGVAFHILDEHHNLVTHFRFLDPAPVA